MYFTAAVSLGLTLGDFPNFSSKAHNSINFDVGIHTSTALSYRRLGEAMLDVISGERVPVNLMVLQPETGKTLYAMSGLQWGALDDASQNRDR